MDPNNQLSQQDHSSRAPKIRLFLKLIIILLVPLVVIKIVLSFPKSTQQYPQNSPKINTLASVTPYFTKEPTTQPTLATAKSVPPLTQATLDDWSKKLASGSEADFRSVVELPNDEQLFPGAIKTLSALAPFHFKLDTFKKDSENTTGSIMVEIGSANKKKSLNVSLQVINGEWKIVNIEL